MIIVITQYRVLSEIYCLSAQWTTNQQGDRIDEYIAKSWQCREKNESVPVKFQSKDDENYETYPVYRTSYRAY